MAGPPSGTGGAASVETPSDCVDGVEEGALDGSEAREGAVEGVVETFDEDEPVETVE
jgi:hypothetical protein